MVVVVGVVIILTGGRVVKPAAFVVVVQFGLPTVPVNGRIHAVAVIIDIICSIDRA